MVCKDIGANWKLAWRLDEFYLSERLVYPWLPCYSGLLKASLGYLYPITVIDTALQSAKAQKAERTTVSYFLVAFNRKIGVYFITYISQGKMARYKLSTGYRLSNILVCLLCCLLLWSLSFSASSLKIHTFTCLSVSSACWDLKHKEVH